MGQSAYRQRGPTRSCATSRLCVDRVTQLPERVPKRHLHGGAEKRRHATAFRARQRRDDGRVGRMARWPVGNVDRRRRCPRPNSRRAVRLRSQGTRTPSVQVGAGCHRGCCDEGSICRDVGTRSGDRERQGQQATVPRLRRGSYSARSGHFAVTASVARSGCRQSKRTPTSSAVKPSSASRSSTSGLTNKPVLDVYSRNSKVCCQVRRSALPSRIIRQNSFSKLL